MTGLHNRRFLDEALPRERARAQRDGSEFAVAMLDIDHFKKLNDTHGHAAGDHAIRAVAEAIRGRLRESDLLCRFGGEEFTAILPATKAAQALGTIQSVCDGIGAMRIAHRGAEMRLTLSAGIATAPARRRCCAPPTRRSTGRSAKAGTACTQPNPAAARQGGRLLHDHIVKARR
jgi:diguanylate cyclase (GGDEF)-like protein